MPSPVTCSRSISGSPRPSCRADARSGARDCRPAASTSASMSSCSRQPACIAKILAVQLRDDVRRLAARRSPSRWIRSSRAASGSKRSSAGARIDHVHRSCRADLPSSVRRAPPNASRASLTCQPCASRCTVARATHGLVAQRAAQIRAARAEARALVEALAFRLRAHVDASRKLFVQLDRIDVVGAGRELPGARLRELQLPAAGQRCRRTHSTSYCAIVSCSFDSTPLRRALRRREIRTVDLRGRS